MTLIEKINKALSKDGCIRYALYQLERTEEGWLITEKYPNSHETRYSITLEPDKLETAYTLFMAFADRYDKFGFKN